MGLYRMKKAIKPLLIVLSTLAIFGCHPEEKHDYSLYYSYRGNMKGIEVYCWNKKEVGILVFCLARTWPNFPKT